METPELSFTLAYWVFCLCFVFTPNEFRSAGLTVQNLFSSWLGSEDMGFVQYHIRRSSVTLLVHSALPLGYYLGMCLAAPEHHMEHILEVSTYSVSMALQSQCQVSMVHSRQHHMSPDSASPTQILTLKVDSTNRSMSPFHIRLNSIEYSELRDKLHSPVQNLTNVVIYQSVSELFLDTFRAQVQDNPMYSLPRGQELEPCIGCMLVAANVKLLQLCQSQDSDSDSDCQRCQCRPMWCVSCMGRWFASRQNQQRPETWLSSKVPCPTCRANFCVLDVCVVRSSS
ncbi:E3 ubiquitin-protein ligase TM129 isoform X3 [Eucyclogobius newberryi]|uniref:E3 ubiquitin-protein ligase TM129 isoform X3 n=1 Tax=Eucyclogobius newberryi TaxID=166745 RepID=UPI003B5B6A0F